VQVGIEPHPPPCHALPVVAGDQPCQLARCPPQVLGQRVRLLDRPGS
jgi:hypothetical protein